MNRDVPSLQSVSAEYARIVGRLSELVDREHVLNSEMAAITHSMINLGAVADGLQRDRVADTIAGKPFEPRRSAMEDLQRRIVDINEEKRLIREAQHQLHNRKAEEYARASRAVCATFSAEHEALAAQFYELLSAAAEVRVKIGLLRLDVERSGASASSLYDAGVDLLDGSLDRTGSMAYELRNGVRRGYLKAENIPVELR
jgi:hypothetical protein